MLILRVGASSAILDGPGAKLRSDGQRWAHVQPLAVTWNVQIRHWVEGGLGED